MKQVGKNLVSKNLKVDLNKIILWSVHTDADCQLKQGRSHCKSKSC